MGGGAARQGGVVFILLETQPLATFVLAKRILVPITNVTCIGLTIVVATAVARHEGLLPTRTAILPAWPSRTSRATR